MPAWLQDHVYWSLILTEITPQRFTHHTTLFFEAAGIRDDDIIRIKSGENRDGREREEMEAREKREEEKDSVSLLHVNKKE